MLIEPTTFGSTRNIDKVLYESSLHMQVDNTEWIRLHIPSCGPGFESKAHHLCSYIQIFYYICHRIEKRTKIDKKRQGLAHLQHLLIARKDENEPRKRRSSEWAIKNECSIN